MTFNGFLLTSRIKLLKRTWNFWRYLLSHPDRYIFTRTVRKALWHNIREKQNLNLICFVSFKNQNWEMYCLLLTAFYDPQNNNNFWNFWLGQISHTIFWGAEGLGEGCMKITLIVSCLEWLTCLFLFIVVEFEKVLKNGTHFSCDKSLPKGYNVQMSKCSTLTWDTISRNGQWQAWWPECVQPPTSPGKLAAQLKSPFGNSCLPTP